MLIKYFYVLHFGRIYYRLYVYYRYMYYSCFYNITYIIITVQKKNLSLSEEQYLQYNVFKVNKTCFILWSLYIYPRCIIDVLLIFL